MFVFHAVSRERIAICVAYSGIIAGIGSFAGALIGGFLASVDSPIFGLKPILFVFLLSAMLRFIVSAIFIDRFNEVRKVSNLHLSMRKILVSFPRHLLTNAGIKRTVAGHSV